MTAIPPRINNSPPVDIAEDSPERREFSAEFAMVEPGDYLTNPATGRPIAIVTRVRNATVKNPGKPTRYTITLECEEISR